MARPKTPTGLYVNNGWWMEMPGLVSPHFQTLDGKGVNSNTVDVVDAGTNIKHKFSAQVLDFSEMTLTRSPDGSSDDKVMQSLFDKCVREGYKFDTNMVKTHFGNEVYRIAFVGFRLVTQNDSTYDVNGEEKLTKTYTATCEYWFEV